MTVIERQVVRAQRRLWLNRWLSQWGWCLFFAAALWLTAWLVDRLLVPGRVPAAESALVALGLSLATSLLWLWRTHERPLAAATALDEAAGLRERVSSSLWIRAQATDPFAGAVVADAERVVTGLTAGKFIPVRWSRSLSFSALMVAAALLSLLLPEFDLLNRSDGQAGAGERSTELRRVQALVAQPTSVMKEIEEKHPDLKLDAGDRKYDNPLDRRLETDPDVLRREAIKKLDRLQDALKQKAAADRFKALSETKDRLKQLGEPSDPKTELGRLMEALSDGDFQEAQNSIKKVQEELAKRAREGKLDPQTAEKMKEQLNEMAQKLQQAAQDKQSERELQNAGLSKADAQRVLEALAKKDPEQLEKLAKEMAQRLKQQGMTEQQMKEMMEKIQQRQQACKQCEGLGQKMGQAAQMMDSGSLESAEQELESAGEMLSEMEQLEQTLNDMQSQMSELDQARDQLNNEQNDEEGQCQACGGTGFRPDGSPCPHCGGSGKQGGGKPGNSGGWGGAQARDDSAKTGTVDSKAKTQTRKDGSIIGQSYVKGQLLTGKSDVEFIDAAKAAEIDATDSQDKERIPRIYRKGLKKYFDRLGDDLKGGKKAKDAESGDAKNGGDSKIEGEGAKDGSGKDGASGEAESNGAESDDRSGS